MSNETPETDAAPSGIDAQIKQVPARIFGDDILEFEFNLLTWKRKLQDLSIRESEAINAAIVRINILASPERRKAEAKRLGIPEKEFAQFDAICELIMDGYLNDLKLVMSRRDESDKRKTRYRQ